MWPFQQNVPITGADPHLTKGLWPGASLTITESNSVWTPVFAPVPCVLQAPSAGLVIRYRPMNPGGGTGDVFGTSRNGVALLLVTGQWQIQMPVTGAGPHTVTQQDLRFYGTPEAANIGPGDIAPVNLAQIGGTAQTALDLTARHLPPSTFASATFTTTAGDASLFAANSARKMLSVSNNGSAWAGIGVKASALTGVNESGAVFFVLPPNSSYTWQQPAQPPPVGAIRVYTSSALSTIWAQEGN